MAENIIHAVVWVVCKRCGGRHELRRGIDAPVYWCGDNLRKLVVGDEVECEESEEDEEDGLRSISSGIGKLGRPLGVPLRHWELFFKTGRFPKGDEES